MKLTHREERAPDNNERFQVPGSKGGRAFVASPRRLRPQCGSISHPLWDSSCHWILDENLWDFLINLTISPTVAESMSVGYKLSFPHTVVSHPLWDSSCHWILDENLWDFLINLTISPTVAESISVWYKLSLSHTVVSHPLWDSSCHWILDEDLWDFLINLTISPTVAESISVGCKLSFPHTVEIPVVTGYLMRICEISWQTSQYPLLSLNL